MAYESGFNVKEYEFKINLSKQIDRIAELLSAKVEGIGDPVEETKRLVNAKLNAVDTLQAMLKFYWKNNVEFKKELAALKENFKEKFKDKDEYRSIISKEEYVEKKFAIVMDFIGQKGWLIEEGVVVDEGKS